MNGKWLPRARWNQLVMLIGVTLAVGCVCRTARRKWWIFIGLYRNGKCTWSGERRVGKPRFRSQNTEDISWIWIVNRKQGRKDQKAGLETSQSSFLQASLPDALDYSAQKSQPFLSPGICNGNINIPILLETLWRHTTHTHTPNTSSQGTEFSDF